MADIQLEQTLNLWEHYFDFISSENAYMKAAIILFMFSLLSIFVWAVYKVMLRRLVKKTASKIDDNLVKETETPLLLIINLLGVYFAGNVFMLSETPFYKQFFLTGIVYLMMLLLYRGSKVFLLGLTSKGKVINHKVYPFIEQSLTVIVIVLFMFIAFPIWGINLTPLIASAGLVGIALAFAAQDTVKNIFGAVSIYFDKSYQIGDYVIVDKTERGEVVDIGLRSTKLRTMDNVYIIIPNSIMANSTIVNETGIQPKLRVRVPVEVSYGADLDKVEKVLLEVAKKADFVEKEPAPVVGFTGFKDYSIGVLLLFWVKDPSIKPPANTKMVKEIYRAFNRHKIAFPYPTQDINLRKLR